MQIIAIINNYILPKYLNDEFNLEEIHTYVYIAATTTLSTIGLSVTEHRENAKKKYNKTMGKTIDSQNRNTKVRNSKDDFCQQYK